MDRKLNRCYCLCISFIPLFRHCQCPIITLLFPSCHSVPEKCFRQHIAKETFLGAIPTPNEALTTKNLSYSATIHLLLRRHTKTPTDISLITILLARTSWLAFRLPLNTTERNMVVVRLSTLPALWQILVSIVTFLLALVFKWVPH